MYVCGHAVVQAGRLSELAEVDRGALALLVGLRPFQEDGKVLGMPLNIAESCM